MKCGELKQISTRKQRVHPSFVVTLIKSPFNVPSEWIQYHWKLGQITKRFLHRGFHRLQWWLQWWIHTGRFAYSSQNYKMTLYRDHPLVWETGLKILDLPKNKLWKIANDCATYTLSTLSNSQYSRPTTNWLSNIF